MPLLVGTSGWQYAHWRGVLYPPGLPQRVWLERYAECFATVENNNAFYRLPSREVFEGWRRRTPPEFVMAVKASRFLTHIKRLKDPEEPVDRLMGVAGGLGGKLGPVLLQLPPTLRVDLPRLDRCLRRFPPGVRVAVEPRHPSWWTPEVRELLTRHGAALCWADRLGRPLTPLWRTASWSYTRLHEGAARPWPRYGDQALRAWVRRIGAPRGADAEVGPGGGTDAGPGAGPDAGSAADPDAYVYFNNDPGGAAVRDAVRFAAIARRAGLAVSRTPEPAVLTT